MIRKANLSDINIIYNIWESGIKDYNREVKPDFWEAKKEIMLSYFSTKDVFVFENENILGFICIEDDGNILAIFVDEKYRSLGIGRDLLIYAKKIRKKLYSSVYSKNIKSNYFFVKNDFRKMYSQVDNNTSCEEFFYEWRKDD